jgi:archaellum component FlaC
MNKDEAIYQIKQRIKMHELEGTTSIENEREKALLNYITNLQQIEQDHQKLNGELREEIERLNNIINELNECYIKVINKCNWIVDHRYYMTEVAIKKSAEEIKDICKYYVKVEWYDAKELKEGTNER